jgi:hypothetical protein
MIVACTVPCSQEWSESLDDAFGMEGLLRGITHLMRAARQSRFSDDVINALDNTSYLYRRDYWAKLESKMHLEGKSEAFAAGTTSVHGGMVMFKVREQAMMVRK